MNKLQVSFQGNILIYHGNILLYKANASVQHGTFHLYIEPSATDIGI